MSHQTPRRPELLRSNGPLRSNAPPRSNRRHLFRAATAVAAAFAFGRRPLAAAGPDAPADDSLQREGTKLTDHAGHVRQSGSRWELVGSDGSIYQILENLALWRIVLAMREDPEDRYWTVDGELTEFADENYLLIRRTLRTAKTNVLPERP